MGNAFGIDLSKYQCSHGNDSRLVNFDAIANHSEKVSFIIARASVSYGYVDPRYAYYKEEAKRIGVPFGSYHYCYPAAPYAKQMATFLGVVRPDEHSRLALDLENAQGMYKNQITDWTNNALQYIRERTGRYPMIYSRKSWVDPNLDVLKLPSCVEWWLADYALTLPTGYAPEKPQPPRMPRGVTNWLIHQVGDKLPPLFNVASRTMDCDRWNGDDAAVLAYFGYDGAIEPPPPPEPPDPDEPLFVGVVTAEPYLNIREYPTTQSEDLGDLYPGRRLNIFESVPNWYWMQTIDDPFQEGWVASAYVARDWGGGLINVPLFSQLDPRWRYKKLGTSNSTIGSQGCAITSLCMACAYYGKNTNPDLFNQALIRVDGYENHNLVRWWKVSSIYPDIVIRDFINCEKTPAPLELINSRLAEGIPVIVKVDYYPGGAVQQHWIILCKEINDDYIAADPISGTFISFRSKYGDPSRYIFRVLTVIIKNK